MDEMIDDGYDTDDGDDTDSGDVEDIESSDAAGAEGEQSRGPLVQWVALAVGAILMAGGLFAFLVGGDKEAYPVANARDMALIAAHQHIETLNTMDHRDVDAGLAAWEAATTGLLHDQTVAITEAQRTALAEHKKTTSGQVVDAAVLDATKETATVIAAVEITVQDDLDPDSEPSLKRNRFTADLVLVDGEWLLENLQQVAVNLS